MAKCPAPIAVKDKLTGTNIFVPCGKCYDCLMRKISEWAWRLQYEQKHSYNSYFVTITYATEQLPFNTTSCLPTLDKTDLQKAFKRYRKQFNHTSILGKTKTKIFTHGTFKYFACGEYGDQTSRPHYHALLFNVDILEFQKHWAKGKIHVGEVNEQSITYTLKYMLKQSLVTDIETLRAPEFRLMSKGLGKGYLNKPENITWHNEGHEDRFSLPVHNIHYPMPRLFKQLIYPEYKRKKIAQTFADKFLQEKPPDDNLVFENHLIKQKKVKKSKN